jgi:hypothetical protein
MDWSTLAPAVFSLLGVALGTAGSVLAAYYAHRSSREQQRRQIRTSLREERKQMILEFLLEVERCWRFLEGYWERAPLVSVKGEPLPKELIELEAAQRSNELWYQQRKLALVTEQPIPQLGLELTEKIWQAIHRADRIKVSLYQHLNPAHEEFIAAANKYLTDETRF